MPKTKEDILEYNEIVEEVKHAESSGVISKEDKDFLLTAISNGFYKDNEIPVGTPERERLDAIVDKVYGL